MKTMLLSFAAAMLFVGCGLQDIQIDPLPDSDTTSDAGTTADPDTGTPPVDAGTIIPADAGTVTPVDAGTVTPIATDAGTVTPMPDPMPAPFYSPDACCFAFSSKYVSGATCGEARGNGTGMSWISGPKLVDLDHDGYLVTCLKMDPGTYTMSYLGYQDCADSLPKEAWAQYGGDDQLLAMTAEVRKYIRCTWWDAAAGVKIDPAKNADPDDRDPKCNIRVTVDSACNVTPAGNMENFKK